MKEKNVEKKPKSSQPSKKQLQRRFQQEEKKQKELKEYKELEDLLSYSDDLYNSIDYIKINIASPERIRSWGRRSIPTGKNFRKFSKVVDIFKPVYPARIHTTMRKGDDKILEILYQDENLDYIGEVVSSHTIHFKENKPLVGGLFCQKIFGPIKNWECACGKYNGSQGYFLSKFCEKCLIELTDSRVRRYRMGFHYLNIPVAHFWYISGRMNYFLLFLNMEYEKSEEKIPLAHLHEVLYTPTGKFPPALSRENRFLPFAYPAGNIALTADQERRISNLLENFIQAGDFDSPEEAYEVAKYSVVYGDGSQNKIDSKYRRGGEILEAALEQINLVAGIQQRRKAILKDLEEFAKDQINSQLIYGFYFEGKNHEKEYPRGFYKYLRRLKELRLFESFVASKTKLSWMLLTVLPIMPAGLRNIYEDDAGILITSDLNTFYVQIIQRNKVLLGPREFLEPNDVEVQTLSAAHSHLQEAVDRLIDNARTEKPYSNNANTALLKSLTETLEGKEGRFRLNLFGKRVNYSARSVIIVGPHLRLNQCSIPYKMAKILFAPLLHRKILELQLHNPIYEQIVGINLLRLNRPKIILILMRLVKEYCVLLNRAPTLHKFGIQAFEPLITLSQAIELHPLVCTGFNADFDGDQMGLYLPLFNLSQLEVAQFMKPSLNIFSPANGEPVVKPTQDMVIGANYLTHFQSHTNDLCYKAFTTETQVLERYYQKKLSIHTHVFVKYDFDKELFKIEKNELFFFTNFLSSFEKKIVITKIIFGQGNISRKQKNQKLYIFTNLGILLAYQFSPNCYEMKSFFIETTPGRILVKKYLQISIDS